MRELIIGIVTILIFEGLRLLFHLTVRWCRRRNALDRLLRFDGEVSLACSVVSNGGKQCIRECDTEVVDMLPIRNRQNLLHEFDSPVLSDPSRHLIVIGSTRHNVAAQAIQRHFTIPYRFVFITAGADAAARELTIVSEDDEEFRSSLGYGDPARGEAVDYGILLAANLSNQKRVLWIAGIHGEGTLGVAQFLTANASAVNDVLGKSRNSGAAWLIRVKCRREGGKKVSGTQMPELIGSPRPVFAFEGQAAQALICDFGNVVMEFDRSRTYRAIAHFLNRDFRDVQKAIGDEGEHKDNVLLSRYESGKLDTKSFMEELRLKLKCSEAELPTALLQEFWGDIFWERPQMHAALASLHAKKVPLVLLSNTNPLHFDHVKRDYPDIISLFDDVVLSYKEKTCKPDPELFRRALDAVRQRGVHDVKQMLYVDDNEAFVKVARQLGMRGFTYQSYSKFAFWLAQNGLWVE